MQGQATRKNGLSVTDGIAVNNGSLGINDDNIKFKDDGHNHGNSKPLIRRQWTEGFLVESNGQTYIERDIGACDNGNANIQRDYSSGTGHAYLTGSVSKTGTVTLNDGDNETRPINSTLIIWRRTA